MIEEATQAVLEVPPSMGWIRLTFPEEGFSIDVTQPDPETNPIFRAAAMTYLQPVRLAAQLGRISEERNEELLAACYARGGVIVGSITPELANFNETQWEAWLLQDRDRFRIIRSYCEVKSNFQIGGGEPDADSIDGTIIRSGVESSGERD